MVWLELLSFNSTSLHRHSAESVAFLELKLGLKSEKLITRDIICN